MVGREILRKAYLYVASLTGYPDRPEWDATDFAHPAWWRGNDVGVRQVTLALTLALDGMDDGLGVYGHAPLEALRRRILQLRRDTNEPRDVQSKEKYGAGDPPREPGSDCGH